MHETEKTVSERAVPGELSWARFLHVNFVLWEFSGQTYWIEANLIESLFYFAVPCFFMISGVTLMDYRERCSTREYFKKRIGKTVIPFVF